MLKKLTYNMGKYARFILRRDRIRIPVWLISITLLTILVAFAYTELVPTVQDRLVMAETMRNPAVTAMFGPGYGLDNYTIGAIMGHQMLLFTALVVAIMSILLVARHTRGDEESGRIEMIRSLPVGRLSNLGASTLVMLGTNVLLALLVGFGLYWSGIETLDLQGSLLYGAALGAAGFIFAAVTALFAQLSDSSRGTMGYSFAFLGFAYLIRGIGDVGNETLSWLSPLGWITRSEVYVNNIWWPVLLTIAAAFAILALAFYLNSIRDLEAGFIPTKPGRKTASAFLQSPFGLAVRLQLTVIIAWAVGMFILGASYGSVLGDLESYLESMELIQEMLIVAEGFSLTEQFLPMLMAVISMVGAIPVLIMILRLKGEENSNRTEHLLARAVSRTKIMGSFLAISFAAGFVMLFLAVTGMWSAGAAVMDDPVSFETIFNAGMIYLPAIWVMIGVAVFLIGFVPKRTGLTWLYLGYSFFVVYMGGILQLPEWLAELSPFGHIPKLPVEGMDLTKMSILTALAIALTVIGFIGYNKRDIQG